MRFAFPLLSFFALALVGTLPGVDLTKTGPDRPGISILAAGGGGGP